MICFVHLQFVRSCLLCLLIIVLFFAFRVFAENKMAGFFFKLFRCFGVSHCMFCVARVECSVWIFYLLFISSISPQVHFILLWYLWSWCFVDFVRLCLFSVSVFFCIAVYSVVSVLLCSCLCCGWYRMDLQRWCMPLRTVTVIQCEC